VYKESHDDAFAWGSPWRAVATAIPKEGRADEPAAVSYASIRQCCWLDTALIMAADTISGYIQGLLDGIEFKQTAYALDRDSRKAALARFLKRASGADGEKGEEERRLAA
jgi:hypothetical protein